MKSHWILAGLIPLSAQAMDYSFISGADIQAALQQESMVVQGYLLGVADALKGAEPHCFTVPVAADADQQLIQAYLNHWATQPPPADGVQALVQAFSTAFPCSES